MMGGVDVAMIDPLMMDVIKNPALKPISYKARVRLEIVVQ